MLNYYYILVEFKSYKNNRNGLAREASKDRLSRTSDSILIDLRKGISTFFPDDHDPYDYVDDAWLDYDDLLDEWSLHVYILPPDGIEPSQVEDIIYKGVNSSQWPVARWNVELVDSVDNSKPLCVRRYSI
jgi:hypothetical protein